MHYVLYNAPVALAGAGLIALLVAWRRGTSPALAWALLTLGYAGMVAWELHNGRLFWAALDGFLLAIFAFNLAKELRFRVDAWVLPRYAEKWRARKVAEEVESRGDA